MNKTTRALTVAGFGLSVLAGCGGSSDGAATAPSASADNAAAVSTPAADTATAAAAPASSEAYTSPDGSYTVNFPAPPTVTDESQPMAGGELGMEIVSVESDMNRYAVVHADASVVSDGSPEVMGPLVDGLISGFMSSSGGQQTSIEDITFEGRPAKRFTFEAMQGDQTFTGISLVVTDGAQVFQVATFGTDEAAHQEFVDSFHLTQAAGG